MTEAQLEDVWVTCGACYGRSEYDCRLGTAWSLGRANPSRRGAH